MTKSAADWSELEIFARGPVVVFRWQNLPGWPVEYVSPNADEVFGYSADQFLRGDAVYAELIHPEDIERVSAEVAEGAASAEGTFVHKPYRITRADGSTRWLYDMTHVIRDNNDTEPTHFLGYVVDITKQIDAENQHHALELKLLQTQKLESLGILASGVAHDFNNFLTGILGEIDLIRFELGAEPTTISRRITGIETLAVQAAELTKQLLTYSGARQNPPQLVKLDDLVREVVSMLGTVIASNATVELNLDAVQSIVVDRTQVIQVVMNLLTNASEALEGKPGRIVIRLSEIDGLKPHRRSICLTVEDTGCGMSKEIQSRLFDPFFTTKSSGRGLGMSAVQGILRAHGGEIHVESVPNEGTKFLVCLPTDTPKPAK
jgi:two-component system cell cycle sensor histidine kinase/response regulator CckA